MLKYTKIRILLTQSVQEKYQQVVQEPSNTKFFEFHWFPFISLQKSKQIQTPLCINTRDVFITSAKTLDFLDCSLLEGKNIYVVGEKTAYIIQQMGIGTVQGVYKSAREVVFEFPCTFIGATLPTQIVQEKIQNGELLHLPVYDRIEHRNHIIPSDIEWVAFLSPSAVGIWFETYSCTESTDVRYAVIGETTNRQLKIYQKEASVIPSQPNFQLLLDDILIANLE